MSAIGGDSLAGVALSVIDHRHHEGEAMTSDIDEAVDRRTSRQRFIRQVGIGVFAAVPVIKAIAFPGAASAGGDPPDCEFQTCVYDGHNCCQNSRVGDEYACYDRFTHDFCQLICRNLTSQQC